MLTDVTDLHPPAKRLLIAGAGGHARVVVDAARRAATQGVQDSLEPALIVDDNPALHGTHVLGVKVVSRVPYEADGAFAFHVAIGNNALREQKFAVLVKKLTPVCVVHPHASVAESATLGAGSFVAAQAVIAPQAILGAGCIVNHGAVVDHGCVVGAFCHIAPNATLAGNVRLGHHVLVGAGANLLPGVVIGDDCVIGAGAVVLNDIEAGTNVAGVPARSIDRENN